MSPDTHTHGTSPTNESGDLEQRYSSCFEFLVEPVVVDGAKGREREREREKRREILPYFSPISRTFTIKASLAQRWWSLLASAGGNAVGSHAPHTSTVLMQIQPALRITRCNVTVGEQTSWARLEF